MSKVKTKKQSNRGRQKQAKLDKQWKAEIRTRRAKEKQVIDACQKPGTIFSTLDAYPDQIDTDNPTLAGMYERAEYMRDELDCLIEQLDQAVELYGFEAPLDAAEVYYERVPTYHGVVEAA